VPTQDHKALLDGDQGPNTGGMGAFSDDSILSESLHDEILRSIVAPTLAGMEMEGSPTAAFVFRADDDHLRPHAAGIQRPPGRPETQPIMMRLRSDLAGLLMASRQANWQRRMSIGVLIRRLCVVLTSKGYPGSRRLTRDYRL